MHLIVPFAAATSEAGRHALHDLPLPQLERLLARLQPQPADAADESTLSPPHERALARALGWTVDDGLLPWAARLARRSGAPESGDAWGLLTPLHLHVGTHQVSMIDPAALQLDDAASRELLAAVRPLLDSEGFTLHYAGPLQWLATHAGFDGLATASLDRVIGRNIDPWLPGQPAARLVRRIQNEVQMLLYTHPINDRREAACLPTVNSFWLSGCGRARPEAAETDEAPIVDDRLRTAALGEDWVAWREAWQQLDAGPVAALAKHDGPVTLTLCGERAAQSFSTGSTSLWQRVASTWRRPAAHTILETL
ncbi:hypothetical protein [Aquabacterium humicola]|uniref:hypothetical protein n=1 Tax=Aquabacterium humicola TaxID=3237377 RepID=UPI002543018A|nr:hypothetical protein [Rubrivivax pictus]